MSSPATERHPIDAVRAAADALAAVAGSVDPLSLSGPEAMAVVADAVRAQKLAAAITTVVVSRVDACGTAKEAGHRSAAEWLSGLVGSSKAEGDATVATSLALGALPVLDGAVRAGELSATQSNLVAGVAVDHPSAEASLVATARSESLWALRLEAASVRHRHDRRTDDEKQRHMHQTRAARWRRHDDGSQVLSLKITPDIAARCRAALDTVLRARFDDARRAGDVEPLCAYEADAIATSICGTPTWAGATWDGSNWPDARRSGAPQGAPVPVPAPAPAGAGTAERPMPHRPRVVPRRRPSQARPVVTARIDLAALLRGDARDGETCAIAGMGPVPVATVVGLLPHAVIHAVGVGQGGAPTRAGRLHHVHNPFRYGPAPSTAITVLVAIPERLLAASHFLGDRGAERDEHIDHDDRDDGRARDPRVAELARALWSRLRERGAASIGATHLGRGPTVAQAAALAWRDPVCAVAGCDRTARLEADHTIDWAVTLHTRLDQLDLLCHFHHARKSHDGWRLERGVGRRRLLPSDHPNNPGHPARAPSDRRAAGEGEGDRAHTGSGWGADGPGSRPAGPAGHAHAPDRGGHVADAA